MTTIYVVTKRVVREDIENICVTDDPDRAKKVRDENSNEERHVYCFIQVWDLHAEEPKYVTREHPGELE